MKKLFLLILGIMIIVSLFGFSGTGTQGDPYLISSLADLETLSYNVICGVTYANKYFIQTIDINLDVSPHNVGVGWTPIGNADHLFSGKYDGYNKKISGLYINDSSGSYKGLFGYISIGAEIRNVKLEYINVSGDSYIGGLVGWNSSGTIENCYSTGSVNGTSYDIGGLVGYNNGTITNCYSSVSVTGGWYSGGLVGGNNNTIENCYSSGSVISNRSLIGGLVGLNVSGTITNCFSTGSVTGSSSVGGLVGENRVIITNCYSTGEVTGDMQFTGGLVGKNSSGSITNCYNNGSITGVYATGGLAGYNTGGTITNCYNRGNMSGSSRVGGLAGLNESGTITYCYSAGSVTATGSDIGGLVGFNNNGTISACYYEEISGLAPNGYGTPKTTAEMTNNTIINNIYLTAGWDFKGEIMNGSNEVWNIGNGKNSGYPYLNWQYQDDPAFLYSPTLGNGSAGNPYQIANWQNLYWISINSGVWSSYFIQTADIDFAVSNPTINTWNGGTGWNPIGIDPTSFTGKYDGNHFKICGLYINDSSSNSKGLFGYLKTGAEIKNVKLEDINVTGQTNVGGLVGKNYSGTITNCYSMGSVTGYSSVGGLVGLNFSGSINNCYSTGSMTVQTYSGGLVGWNHTGTISNSYNTASVTGQSNVGGLVGYIHNTGTITNCYNIGIVECTGNYVGGLVGLNFGTIEKCYNTASVTGSTHIGGLVGSNNGPITNCYNIGSVSGAASYIGGLVGSLYSGSISACYYDSQTSGQSDTGKGEPKTTEEMTNGTILNNIYLTTGWDFKGESINGSNEVWNIGNGKNGGYPYLNWQYPDDPAFLYSPTQGDGSAGNPYQIANWQNLYWISINQGVWGMYFIQTADIDFAVSNPAINTWNGGTGWNPIGNEPTRFTGKYDGNNFKISRLFINRPSSNYQGLYGYISSGVEIKNVKLEDINVIGQNYTGGLTGYNTEGTITNCYTAGSVNGTGNYTGGLAGFIYNGTTTNCYTAGSVNGHTPVGGLAGRISGSIDNCYCMGRVTGDFMVGGFAGYNVGSITNCYSSGSVTTIDSQYVGGLVGYNSGTVTNCYYDANTSGQGDNGKGTPKTTTEMKTENFVSTWGWSADVWERVGVNYPRLKSNPDQTLPVTLSSFTAINTNSNTVSLAWTTQSEINMIGYHVYRADNNNLVDANRVTDQIIQAANVSTEHHYSFTDNTVSENTEYYYWLQSADMSGIIEFYGPVQIKTNSFVETPPVIPVVTQLNSAYPNPFNPSTTISFDLANPENVNIIIFNSKGQLVRNICNKRFDKGKHSIIWDSKDHLGKSCGSGVYFYRMTAGKMIQTRKMMLIK